MRGLYRAARYAGEHWLPGRRILRDRWTGPVALDRPRVFYGHGEIPGAGHLCHGGIVKVQDLLPHFPDTPRQGNIVYLVSSALPEWPPGFLGQFLEPLSVSIVRRAKSSGARFVLNQNGVAYPAWHGKGWERTNKPVSRLLSLAEHVIYQSEFCKRSSDRFAGTPSGSWEILYNPVDTSVFRPAERPVTELARGQVVILLAGSHWAFYRVEAALRTLTLLRSEGLDARLSIAGHYRWGGSDTQAAAQVSDMIASLGLEGNVTQLGPYSQLAAVDLYQRADVLLHTKYNDPCPRVVVEAMSCGLPVVYSASGGVPELVGPDAGVGVGAPEDWENDHPPPPEDLCRAVLAVVERHGHFARAARDRAVGHLDVGPWVQRHREIFEKVLA